MPYEFYAPTGVLFGAGQLDRLHFQTMPGRKAMVVLSNGSSARKSGALDRLLEQLRLAGVETAIFNRVEANPLKSTVEAGARFARKNGCDFIVALGGGSVMDAAKIIAMYALQPGDLWDYVAGATGKRKPLQNPTLPLIAVTTTAGTGSEVDAWGVITNPETNEKIGCGGMDSLFPVLAVVDPELMLTVPPKFTAYQGFDALFHSTEGFISKVSSPMSDMFQLAAIENIGKYLPRAVRDGSDLEAREHVAFANTMSGYSMVVGSCTSEHAMEHAMSAYHQGLPHGAGLDHAFAGVLHALYRKTLLRRTFRADGAGTWQERRARADGFYHRTGRFAAGLRRRRTENVRLRHCARGMRSAGAERPCDNGRAF